MLSCCLSQRKLLSPPSQPSLHAGWCSGGREVRYLTFLRSTLNSLSSPLHDCRPKNEEVPSKPSMPACGCLNNPDLTHRHRLAANKRASQTASGNAGLTCLLAASETPDLTWRRRPGLHLSWLFAIVHYLNVLVYSPRNSRCVETITTLPTLPKVLSCAAALAVRQSRRRPERPAKCRRLYQAHGVYSIKL